jgi:hypothetical protein
MQQYPTVPHSACTTYCRQCGAPQRFGFGLVAVAQLLQRDLSIPIPSEQQRHRTPSIDDDLVLNAHLAVA